MVPPEAQIHLVQLSFLRLFSVIESRSTTMDFLNKAAKEAQGTLEVSESLFDSLLAARHKTRQFFWI